MIRRIAPQFFSLDLAATLAYYRDQLGFECIGTWPDPPVYAIVARDGQQIHFRCAPPPTPQQGWESQGLTAFDGVVFPGHWRVMNGVLHVRAAGAAP
jgi:hypothetical protein